MIILTRYIAKTVIVATCLVVLTVASIVFVISFVTELRDIGIGEYGLGQAFAHVLFNLPQRLYDFLPMLALLGGLVGLGALSSNHELMVMRASGVSLFKLTGSVLCGTALMIVVLTVGGEMMAPHASFLADNHKAVAQNAGQAIATDEGVWLHQGDSFFKINHIIGRNRLEGITRYQFDKQHRLLAAYYVDVATYSDHHWLMQNLVKTSFIGDRATRQTLTHTRWDIELNPNLLQVGWTEPSQLSLTKLRRYTKGLTENGLQASEFQLEFWRRVFKPFTAIVMLLLALPFVLTAPRATTMGWRLFLGVLIGFSFYILNAFITQISLVYQVPPLLAAVIPGAVCAVLGLIMMQLKTE